MMKLGGLVLLWVSCLVAISFSAVRAQDASEDPVVQDAEETPLMQQMLVLKDGMKFLRRGLRNPEKNAESLEWVQKMQENALASKRLIPVMAKEVAEEKRAEFTLNYRREMIVLLQELLKLESVVLDGNNDEAREIYKTLKTMEVDGHEKFTTGG
jgi:soluble cytochrome b562